LSAEDLTEEESKDPHIIKLDMKPYNADLAKTTAFFTDYSPESILKLLTDSLNSYNTPYEISNKTWKLNYTKTREEDKKEESGLVMKEQAVIQIELFDAGNQRICVEFKRKQGSSMVFYDQFNMLRDELAYCNNQQI